MGAIQMQMIAQGYLVYGLTGSPALLGLVNSAFALPMLLLALFGGAGRCPDRGLGRDHVVSPSSGIDGHGLGVLLYWASSSGHDSRPSPTGESY